MSDEGETVWTSNTSGWRSNPVPGTLVEVRYGAGDLLVGKSDDFNWKATGHCDGASDIVAFRLMNQT